MHSQRKRWALPLALLVSAGLLASSLLTGCTPGKGPQNTAEAGEILIGGNYELSGGNATYGAAAVNGIKLYIDDLNEKGGLLGKKVKFVSLDNKSEAGEASNVAARLINQEKVVAILGGAASSSTVGFVKLANDKKTPVISSSAVAAEVTVDESGKTRDYVFRACFTAPFQGEVMAQYALDSLKLKKAAVLVDNQSPYSKGSGKAFKDYFIKNGGQVVAEEGYVTGDKDFRSVLTRIKGADAELIYVPGYYEEAGFIVKQARELGMPLPILGGDGWDSPTLAKIAGAENLNNTFFSTHYSEEEKSARVQDFMAAYKTKYGENPEALGALGYDAAAIVCDAIKRANSTDPEKIREALIATKDLQAVTGTISFDNQHNPVKSAVVVEVKNGKFTFKDKITPKS
ncbi:ABC transporter substrate-binding protein [Heliobacterium gestii]|uniref:ABC transporter substrate-binding protein n=1 Tax=Heliomicrobium gestii TaxID=2699 RepID=A0A845LDB0_HELGE|nr:ABC transporter substrate-binding protein [Heliomicrobium gestii]MBM7868512.1 branched-chain amino acid transport system substrate-binding protein [Heliomicrobium gestii]MZP44662.1 ABC transporter substrate-binding protein [Heliomicrobium gestii]